MKLSIFILFFSTFLFAQNSELDLIKKYGKYDSLDVYSKEFPTKLIEGSGTLRNKKSRTIGSIGFTTEISKNVNGGLIRIKNNQTFHYKKIKRQIAKTELKEITIYFNEKEEQEFSKFINELLINGKLVQKKVNFYNLKNIDIQKTENYEIRQIMDLLAETKTER